MAATPRQPPESARALGVGITFAVTVALFAVGGHWLDGQVGTSPLFVLVGLVLGLVGGTIHMLRILAPSALPFGRSKSTPANGSNAHGNATRAPAVPRAKQPSAGEASSDDDDRGRT